MGITEEPTPASADQPEQSVQDVILEMLDQDCAIDATVKDTVLDALTEVVGHSQWPSGRAGCMRRRPSTRS